MSHLGENGPDSKMSQSKSGCLEKLTKKLKLVEDGATPPNWKYIGLAFLALFSSSSTLTFLFPFLPEMMLTFGYSENEKGTYAGMVASAVFGGRVFGSVFWGWLADRHGRKLVLLITIALNGTFAGLFGLSHNLAMAIFFRFMCGVVNGTVGTGKTILYDISDNTNQAVSMSMLSISWGMGMIVGPTAGGLLASPAIKWPHVFSQDGLFGEYPYLLSSLFPLVSCAIIFTVIFVFFDETLVIKKSSRGGAKELVVPDPDSGARGDYEAEKENHLPLLGGMSKGSQNTLLQLGQSMQSVNIEAESAAFMALKLAQEQSKPIKLLPLKQKALSEPELISHKSLGLAPKDLSQSTSNLYRKSISRVIANPVSMDAANDVGSSASESKDKGCAGMRQVPEIIIMENERAPTDNKSPTSSGKYHLNGKISRDHSAPEGEHLLSETAAESTLTHPVVEAPEEEENICWCAENGSKSACCKSFRNTSLFRLLRLSDVWATVMLYTVFSFIIVALEDVFPVFASTTQDYGGLGFSTDEIGLALGIIFLPLLVLQVKLYPFLVSKFGIRKVFLLSAIVCLITSQAAPTVRVFNNNRPLLWACLLAVQIPFKIATNCCFAGTSLLINNSVTQDLAGQANGLAMMVTAMGRTIAPMMAGSLFSWSITYGPDIGLPFDSSFTFFIIGTGIFVTILECLNLNPKLDRQKK